MDTAIVLFDGICNLCTRSVRFILQRDSQGYFRFAALQSPIGQLLLDRHGISSGDLSSVVPIEHDKAYTGSDAALHIARHLGGAWPLLSLLVVVPRPLREGIYS